MSLDAGDFRDERAGVTEVLRSLVDSPSDLQSTLDVILGHAVRLAHTDSGFIYLKDGEVYRHVSDVGASPEVVEFNRANPIRPGRGLRPAAPSSSDARFTFPMLRRTMSTNTARRSGWEASGHS